MRSASLKICLLLALGASLFMSGCGPLSAHFAIADAQVAIKNIRNKDMVVYEYYSAVLYLDKAKREEGRSSFQEAVNFAKRSKRFAEEAYALERQLSRARALTPVERRRIQLQQQMKSKGAPAQPAPGVAPAPRAPAAPAPSTYAPPAPPAPSAPAPAPVAPR